MYIKLKLPQQQEPEHFFCRVCGFPLITEVDMTCHSEYSCCEKCFLTFAEARKQKWKDGWRPKEKEVDSYIELRNNVALKRR